MKRRNIVILLGVLLLVGIELIARFYFGLGDPPLSVADPELDYIFAPNQKCQRFGNSLFYNSFSMRSERNPKLRNKGKRRVILCGDSVVNGGALTDQDELASSLLDQKMRETDMGDAWNVSAGSWGPMNYAAYFLKYGTFDATDLIIVLSAHDLWEDDPREDAGKIVGTRSYPSKKPIFAFWEAIDRYFVPKLLINERVKPSSKFDLETCLIQKEDLKKKNLEACRYLFSLPIKNKKVILHRRRDEWTEANIPEGERAFRDISMSYSVPVFLLRLNAVEDYRDVIHLNKHGQKRLYTLLLDIIVGE